MHLVGSVIRIYHDARSTEREIYPTEANGLYLGAKLSH